MLIDVHDCRDSYYYCRIGQVNVGINRDSIFTVMGSYIREVVLASNSLIVKHNTLV